MVSLSPEFRKRCQKFRRNRRSFFSLIFLLALFVVTLPAEMLCNDKPLILRIDGEWFFPAFKSYTYRDMGGEHAAPVLSYRSPQFKAFLAGTPITVDMAAIYRDAALALPVRPMSPPPAARKVWALYPPVRHSYRSYYESEILPRQTLISPGSQVENGQRLPGACEEGHYLGTDKHGKDVVFTQGEEKVQIDEQGGEYPATWSHRTCRVRMSDGTEHEGIVQLCDSDSGENYGVGIWTPCGIVFQDSPHFAKLMLEELGKQQSDIFPYKYNYCGQLERDHHIGTDGWSR